MIAIASIPRIRWSLIPSIKSEILTEIRGSAGVRSADQAEVDLSINEQLRVTRAIATVKKQSLGI